MLQSGAVSAGYMLVATTAVAWESRRRESELFGTLEVPRRFATRAICRAPFAVAGDGWEVRVAAISVTEDERVAWPSTLGVERPRDAPRRPGRTVVHAYPLTVQR